MTLHGGGEAERSALTLLPESPYIIDVGANVGDFSRLALEVRPACQVLAVEPNPNCEIDIPGVEHVTVAAGAHRETATLFYTVGPCQLGSLRRRDLGPSLDHGSETAVVMVVPLRELTDRHVDLLKIDVEGSEVEVLEGAAGMDIDLIVFEHLDDWSFEDGYRPSWERILELLDGYNIYQWEGGWAPVSKPSALMYLARRKT